MDVRGVRGERETRSRVVDMRHEEDAEVTERGTLVSHSYIYMMRQEVGVEEDAPIAGARLVLPHDVALMYRASMDSPGITAAMGAVECSTRLNGSSMGPTAYASESTSAILSYWCMSLRGWRAEGVRMALLRRKRE